uniref:SGNH hydrolase-type esterase domain-containing protein n=1 Tax=Magallana gigas TaxID=29159 RepID=A0A8W8L134_MAGGI
MAGVDPESTKTHVCLLGHSYIRRLAEFMTVNPNLQNLNLDDDRYNISVCARGGLRTYDLHRMIRDVTETPHMFFIQIGGNDIGFIPNKQIVTNIVSFAEYLIYGLGTRVVIIGQLLRRDPSANPPGYNESVTEVNDLLTQKTDIEQHLLLETQGILVRYVPLRQRWRAPRQPSAEKPEARGSPLANEKILEKHKEYSYCAFS